MIFGGELMLPVYNNRIVSFCVAVIMLLSTVVIASASDGGADMSSVMYSNENTYTNTESFSSSDTQAVTDSNRELVSMRTLTTKFFDNGDGTINARIWVNPIHFENENGELVDFKTALTPLKTQGEEGDEYDVGTLQNTLQARFNLEYNAGTKAPVKYSSRDNFHLSWQPGSEQLVDITTMEIVGEQKLSTNPVFGEILQDTSPNMIEYFETYPGITEIYTVSTGKIKHDYIVQQREVLENFISSTGIDSQVDRGSSGEIYLAFSGILSFSKGLVPYIDGEVLSLTEMPFITNSDIAFKSKSTGEIKHYLPSPYAYEQNNLMNSENSVYVIQQSNSDYEISLSVLTPLTWLLSSERAYPIVIDPVDDIYEINPGPSDGRDTFLSDGGNSEYNVGADETLWVGLESSSQWVKARPIIQFDISSIPKAKEIIAAKLKLYLYGSNNNDQSTLTVNAYPVTRDWVEGTGKTTGISRDGACWLYYDGNSNRWSSQGGDSDSSPTSSADISNFDTQYSWNFYDIFEGWYDGSRTNYGFLMKGMSGSDDIKYVYSSDHHTTSERPILEITILTQRPPRIVKDAISYVKIKEDSDPVYVDLNRIFEDPNNDPMEFSIWLNGWSTGPFENENLTVAIEDNNTLMITPRENQYGHDAVWLNANDTLSQVQFRLAIEVEDENDPPKLRPIPDKKGVQGAWLNFTFRATDVDLGSEEKMTFGANVTEQGLPGFTKMTVGPNPSDPTKADVAFLPQNHHVGEFYITFWAMDAHYGRGNASVKFSIKNRNDPPVISAVQVTGRNPQTVGKYSLITLTVNQDNWLNFTLIVDDPDMKTANGEILEFWTNATDEKFKLDSKTGNVSYLPDEDDIGNFYARTYVRDYEGAEDFLDIIIIVKNTQDPAEIIGIMVNNTIIKSVNGKVELKGEFGALQDQYLNFTVIADDSDLKVDFKEFLKFSSNRSLDFNFVLDGRSGEVQLLPGQDNVGLYYVRISVLDTSKDEAIDDEIEIIINVEDVNDPPPIPDLSIAPMGEKSLSIKAMVTTFPIIDPDGDFLSCIWDFGDGTEPEEKVKNDEKWAAEHIYLEPGRYDVKLTLSDGRGGTSTQMKSIIVGDLKDKKPDEEKPTGLGLQSKEEESDSNISLVLMVLSMVIIVILIAFFIYIRTGKKGLGDDEEEEESLEAELFIPELGLVGPGMMQQGGMQMGMGPMYNQSMGYPMYPGTPGLPPSGSVSPGGTPVPPTSGPQMMLPPAQNFNICPQCNQPGLQPLTPDWSSFSCTICGYRV
jgi:hypothetical protein